ncbi:MAG: hypothetical protein R3C49_10270 [Planctomycetaceae bacterium]
MISAAADGSLLEWSTADGEKTHEYSTDGLVPYQLASGNCILAVLMAEPCSTKPGQFSKQQTIRVWNQHSHELRYAFSSDSAAITAIDVSRDGQRLLTSADELLIRDAPTGRLLLTLPGLMRNHVMQELYTYLVTKCRQETRTRSVDVPRTVSERVPYSGTIELSGNGTPNRLIVAFSEKLPEGSTLNSVKVSAANLPPGLDSDREYFTNTDDGQLYALFEDSDRRKAVEFDSTTIKSLPVTATVIVKKTVIDHAETTYTVSVPYQEQYGGTRTICKSIGQNRNFAIFSPDGNRMLIDQSAGAVKVLSRRAS